MENLQLQTPISPRAAGKAAPANDASAAGALGATVAAPTDFQALLQQLMGSEGIAVAPAADSLRQPMAAADATEEIERDSPELTTAGVSPAEPLPLIVLTVLPALPALPVLPPTVAPPPPAIATGNLPALPQAIVNTMEMPSSKLTGKNEPGSLPSARPSVSRGAEAPTGVETAVAETPPPRFLQNIGEAHLARTTQVLPEQALESRAEHHDTAVTELPRVAQGLQLTEPARAPAAASARIDTPVGAPEWNNEFAQKIVWMAGEKQHSAQLHVNPPDLGPVNIRLSIDEKQTSAIFTSPHGDVRQAIEDALPRLREVLAENGITLGNASVTADSPRDGSAFDRQRPSPPPFANATGANGSDAMTEAESGRVIPRSRGNGLVDVFA